MRLVDLETGKVLKRTALDNQWFGEGATRFGNKLYQITWLTSQGFIYSVPDLKQVRSPAATYHCIRQRQDARTAQKHHKLALLSSSIDPPCYLVIVETNLIMITGHLCSWSGCTHTLCYTEITMCCQAMQCQSASAAQHHGPGHHSYQPTLQQLNGRNISIT